MVNRPRIMFLDEPTAGLDPTSAEAIRNIILEERQRGATVFLTTHDMREADKISDRVAFMNQSKIVALDTPHNLKQQFGRRALKAKVTGSDGQLLGQEVARDRYAVTPQQLVGRAADPAQCDAFGSDALGKGDKLLVLRGRDEHFRKHRLVAVDDNVDLVPLENAKVGLASQPRRSLEEYVLQLGGDH